VAVWIPGCGEEFESPTIERMSRIGYFEKIAGTIRVVEGGINSSYRSTVFHTRS
jgi:hypothetical protein